MSEESQLDRIEYLLRQISARVTRLEWRLDEANISGGRFRYVDDASRFAAENDIEVYRDPREFVSLDFQKRVQKWLDQHQDDPDASFYELEAAFSGHGDKTYRMQLIATLRYFALRGSWATLIERMTTNGPNHPTEAWGLHISPYADERTTR